MYYKFIKEKDPENRFDNTTVVLECETVELGELLEGFTDFLRGCGFSVKGTLEVVDE